MMNFPLLTIVSFFALLFPVIAQDSETNGAVKVRTIAVALFENHEQLLLRQGDHNLGELSLSQSQIGGYQQIGSRSFTFGIMNGEDFQTLGRVNIKERGNDFILVFVPTQNGYQVFPVRGDDPGFRASSVQIINLTSLKIGAVLGKAKGVVKPSGTMLIQPEAESGMNFIQARFFYDVDSVPVLFNNTRWPISERLRSLVFVYQSGKDATPSYHCVTDLSLR